MRRFVIFCVLLNVVKAVETRKMGWKTMEKCHQDIVREKSI